MAGTREGRVSDKVAFITGAARGQGRAHAVRLAQEGANVIAVDLCGEIDTVRGRYPLPGEADLDQTATLVREAGGEIITGIADVRDLPALRKAFEAGLDRFGQVDVICANAGIFTPGGPSWEQEENLWQETIDINLLGVWRTVKVAVPAMIEAGRGGSVVLTSSTAGLKGTPNVSHYSSSKHGVVGLMRALANELAPHRIRVNSVHPTSVNTPMIRNDGTYRLMTGGEPDLDAALPVFTSINAIPVPWVEPEDVSNAVLWLASDEARFVTGNTLTVDAGFTIA